MTRRRPMRPASSSKKPAASSIARRGRLQQAGIAGDREQEIIRETAQIDFPQMFQQRPRIAAPENKGIDILLFQADRVSADPGGRDF